MKISALIIGLLFCSIALGEDTPQQPQSPTSPTTTNQPAITTPAVAQTNPSITVVPGSQDIESAEKLFKDATYENFAAQPEHPFIDAANLNNPNTTESQNEY